jgi:deoxyribodipyrimidine photo-lyase
MSSTAIVWLTRDLRLHDHPPLTAALRADARVIPLFVLDPAILHGRFASGRRTAYLLDCLRALDAQLRERGSRLVRPSRRARARAAEAGRGGPGERRVLGARRDPVRSRARPARARGA